MTDAKSSLQVTGSRESTLHIEVMVRVWVRCKEPPFMVKCAPLTARHVFYLAFGTSILCLNGTCMHGNGEFCRGRVITDGV